jgi:hypothetical protein
MIYTVLRLFNDILSLKADVNVSIQRKKQNNVEKLFYVGILKATAK